MVRTEGVDAMCIPPRATVRDALRAIDAGARSGAIVVDDTRRLLGIVTDGDIRRALLRGAGLDGGVADIMTTRPITVQAGADRAGVLDLMKSLRVSIVPEVDAAGLLVGIHTLADVLGRVAADYPALIMAGGKGTRLGELTRNRPKPLMPVAGRPIVEWIVLGLIDSGIRRIYVSVAHLGEQIEEFLGDGGKYGCRIEYVREDPAVPLDTAGALGLYRELPDRPDLPLLVTNGDLMARYDAISLIEHHVSRGAALSIATRSYEHTVPFGVLETDDAGHVTGITEKPQVSFPISAGIYVVSPATLELIPPGRRLSMPELVLACLSRGEAVSAWPLTSDWFDVGTPQDLARAKGVHADDQPAQP